MYDDPRNNRFFIFQLVFGRKPIVPMKSILSYNQFEPTDITGEYALNVKSFLENTQELAVEKVNSRCTSNASRFKREYRQK